MQVWVDFDYLVGYYNIFLRNFEVALILIWFF